MSLRINDVAPDFTVETTEGEIRFHDWIGDGWAITERWPAPVRFPSRGPSCMVVWPDDSG